MNYQTGILDDVPAHCRFMEFDLVSDLSRMQLAELTAAIKDISSDNLIGLGSSLSHNAGRQIIGHRPFPVFRGAIDIPCTQSDLLIAVRGSDRGVITNQSREIEKRLTGKFRRVRLVDGFMFDSGRDLTGYEDGTENPEGEAATNTAIVQNAGNGQDGGSFMAIQQWRHDFDAFDDMTPAQQDDVIGRHRISNEEFDAPSSAHVKRTAQESFDPEAFVLRRSMPWSDATGNGLVFIAYGNSFDAFETLMQNMLGINDGIVDGLFKFTRPETGAYYWCPPLDVNGGLDLSALG